MSWFKILILAVIGIGVMVDLLKTLPNYEAKTYPPMVYATEAVIDTLIFLGVWLLL